jgi:hypothetical protein
MRPSRTLALLSIVTLAGCHHATAPYTPPETPMPPNTILLSQMMRQLSAQPGFNEQIVNAIDKAGKKGPALLTPKLVNELRKRILGKDWEGLDRFPGWTMREINPTVHVAEKVAGKSPALEGMSAVHPGAPPPRLSREQLRDYLDLGPYALDRAETISLNQPSTLPGFTTGGIVTKLGDGVVRGDGPNDLAPEHAESQRLADVLNRLAANGLDGAAPAEATLAHVSVTDDRSNISLTGTVRARTPVELMETLRAAGYIITVTDARYFANFTHLHFNGEDVMAPFWVNTGLLVPHSGHRPLLIPVSHAELEWHIEPPAQDADKPDHTGLRADVSYYFGIDGKSEWRTMDTLDQAWVLKRNAHTYTGEQAVKVTGLATQLTLAYMRAHAAYPNLPFGGYYALGVCQDGVSAVEQAMTGSVTLFPNTVDPKYFTDPRDAHINQLFREIPHDRDGHPPSPDRIFGSLPADPGPRADFSTITIPGLASDLTVTYDAWQDGTLDREHGWRFYIAIALGLLMLVGISAILGEARRRRRLAEQ